MRNVKLIVTIGAFALAACANETTPSPIGGQPPQVDERRVEIYAAVIRDVVEFQDVTVYVWTQICEGADGVGDTAPCPEALTADEQTAVASLLANEISDVRFVDQTEAVAQGIFDGNGGELVRLGPITQVDGRVQVPGSHHCGGLCGGGSIWVVEETGGDWRVTGPAPGHGVWIS